MENSRAAEIATNTYYWKPMAAFFRSLEIALYEKSGVDVHEPLLDLGCGDGGVLKMLKSIGFIKGSAYGMDICYDELRKAAKNNQHLSIFQADANQMPFRDEEFSTVISNGVLNAIPQGVEGLLAEVNRILKPGGYFIATAPTDRFVDVLSLPKIIGNISGRLRSRYVKKLNMRVQHFNAHSPDSWQQRFEKHGLKIISSEEFFPSGDGMVWNILTMRIFQIFGLAKLINSKSLTKSMGGFWLKVFRWLRPAGSQRRPPFGYLFLIAQKSVDPNQTADGV